jgi:hypothetical protein
MRQEYSANSYQVGNDKVEIINLLQPLLGKEGYALSRILSLSEKAGSPGGTNGRD